MFACMFCTSILYVHVYICRTSSAQFCRLTKLKKKIVYRMSHQKSWTTNDSCVIKSQESYYHSLKKKCSERGQVTHFMPVARSGNYFMSSSKRLPHKS